MRLKRTGSQYDRYLDGNTHAIKPGVDVPAKSRNCVATNFREVCRSRQLRPVVEWDVPNNLVIVRAEKYSLVSGPAPSRREPTLDDYLRLPLSACGTKESSAMLSRVRELSARR